MWVRVGWIMIHDVLIGLNHVVAAIKGLLCFASIEGSAGLHLKHRWFGELTSDSISTKQRCRMHDLCAAIITCTLTTSRISTAVCSSRCCFFLGLIHWLVSPPWPFTCSQTVWDSLDKMVTWLRPRLLDLAWVKSNDAQVHFHKVKVMTVALLEHIKTEQLRRVHPTKAADLQLSYISNVLCFLCDQHPLPTLQAQGNATHASQILDSCLCPLCRSIFSLVAELSLHTPSHLLAPGLQHLARRVICQYALSCSHLPYQDASVLQALNILVSFERQGSPQLSPYPGVTPPYTDLDLRRALCHLAFCPAVASDHPPPALQLLHHRLNAWVHRTRQPGYSMQPSDIQQLPFLLRIATICALGTLRRGQRHLLGTPVDATSATPDAYMHVFSICFTHLAAKDKSSDDTEFDTRLITYIHLPACCQTLEMLVRSNAPPAPPVTTLIPFFDLHEQWTCKEQGMTHTVPSLLRRISLAASLRKHLHNAPITRSAISETFESLATVAIMLTMPDNCHVSIGGGSVWTIHHLRFQLVIILGITFARMCRGVLADTTSCHRAQASATVPFKFPMSLRPVLLKVLHAMDDSSVDSTSLQIWERFAMSVLPGRMLPGCSSFDCSSMVGLTERGLQTKLCSGCRRVRYCSAECQQAAWLAGHKHVCKRNLKQARA